MGRARRSRTPKTADGAASAQPAAPVRRRLQPGNQALLRQGDELPSYPHHRAIARAFGLPDFAAPATIDPSVRSLGAEAATEDGHVRFAGPPSLEVAAHEAAHVVQ